MLSCNLDPEPFDPKNWSASDTWHGQPSCQCWFFWACQCRVLDRQTGCNAWRGLLEGRAACWYVGSLYDIVSIQDNNVVTFVYTMQSWVKITFKVQVLTGSSAIRATCFIVAWNCGSEFNSPHTSDCGTRALFESRAAHDTLNWAVSTASSHSLAL